jgi:phosphomannomutase
MQFENGDVAHVRPSGNAPQLRSYAVASTEERAQAMVAMGVREPDGVLCRLIADIEQERR